MNRALCFGLVVEGVILVKQSYSDRQNAKGLKHLDYFSSFLRKEGYWISPLAMGMGTTSL